MPVKGRNNKQYADLRDALRRKGRRLNLPCWLCGHAIDYELPWKHPMSYTYDHVEAVGNGGAMRGEGRPAHRSCNSRRGNNIDRPEAAPIVAEPTRNWYT